MNLKYPHMMSFTSLLLLSFLGACGEPAQDGHMEHDDHTETMDQTIVHLDKIRVYHAGIRTEPVERGSTPIPLSLPGEVTFNEGARSAISARVHGRVEGVEVLTNDRVKAGDVLARLFSQEFLTMVFEYRQAAGSAREGEVLPPGRSNANEPLQKSAEQKLRVIGLTENDLQRLLSDNRQPQFLAIRAPFDGVIIERNVKPGDYVETGNVLFELADLDKVWILADVYESDLPYVRPGMTASVEVDAYLHAWSGSVTSVYPVVDKRTRTVKARIEITNKDGLLKPGMFCSVDIHAGMDANTIKVPASALLGDTERHFVFVAINDTTFERRDVRTGAETRQVAEILDGLLEGERVVVAGGFFLKSELAKETFGEEH